MKIAFSILSILFLLGSCQISAVQGSEDLITKKYDYTDFTSLSISSAVSVEIVQSDNYSVELECNENIEEFIDVKLNGDELQIGVNTNRSLNDVTIKVRIHAPAIALVEASGASYVHFESYKTNNLSVELSGASKIEGSVKISNKLTIESSGASSAKLHGSANNVHLDYSGASTFKGKQLTVAGEMTIESSGASSIETTANGTIGIDASGASNISYYGDAKLTHSETSGASNLTHK